MARVYISYSRKDLEIVRKIVDTLTAKGFDTWVDWEGIPPTTDWLTEIYNGIESSDAILYILSPDSVNSELCAKEIEHGIKNGKRLIPFVVKREGIDPSRVPPGIASLNWMFLDTDSGGLEVSVQKISDAINLDYEWVQTHRRLQVKALEWERKNRDNSYLLLGTDLDEAELALATSVNKEPQMTHLQAEFIFVSRRTGLRRQRQIIVFITTLSVVFLLAGYILGRYAASPQSNSSMNSGVLASGAILILAIGVLSGYLSRGFILQNPTSKPAQLDKNVEEPDALLPETVFISYKRDDWKDYVKPLVLELRENGYKVWIDQNNLEVSSNWMDEINKALKVCQRLVLCVSPASLESEYVKMEYRYFLHWKKTIFPIEVKQAELPAELLGIQNIPYSHLDILTEKLRGMGKSER